LVNFIINEMTRWARGQHKQEHDATSWNDLTYDKKKGTDKKPLPHWERKKNGEGNANEQVPDWLEKRRAARRNRRKKCKPCFHCRESGHLANECPKKDLESDVSDICYKCGRSEHTVHECTANVKEGEYPFAKCFICKEKGHLSGKCPDNPRGLYPDGGGCKFCGSVEHYRKDCPERSENQEKVSTDKKRKYQVRSEKESIDAIIDSDKEDEEEPDTTKTIKKKAKIVKF